MSLTRIGVFARGYPPAFRAGGPVRALEALMRLSPPAFQTAVVTSQRDLGETHPMAVPIEQWVDRDGSAVYYGDFSSLTGAMRAFRALRKRRPEVLYFNSFFSPWFTILPLMLWRAGWWGAARVVIAPRGEFGAGALGKSASKKRKYLNTFTRLGLHRRVLWHSTADHETEDIRTLFGADVALIQRSDDALLPDQAHPVSDPSDSSDSSESEATESAGLRAVYVGRVVAHKGVDVALHAVTQLSEATPLRLDIYGAAEEDDYLQSCRQIAAQAPEHVTIEFHGAIEHGRVTDVFSVSDVLILPTAGENFGYVIPEALSRSCAVMCTPLTPWTQMLQQGGGVVVSDRNPQNWAHEIQRLARLSPAGRRILRTHAGEAYNRWRSQPQPPHLWEQIEQAISDS